MPPPHGPWIMLFGGKKVNPLDLKPGDVPIEVVAHALATTNRWGGQAIKPISVAQHAVYVSRCVEALGGVELAIRQALHHDDSEAVLNDVTHWVKHSEEMTGYRNIEKRVQQFMYRERGLPEEDMPAVTFCDQLMAVFEAKKAFGETWDVVYPGYPTLDKRNLEAIGKWVPWPWRKAEEEYLKRYRALTGV